MRPALLLTSILLVSRTIPAMAQSPGLTPSPGRVALGPVAQISQASFDGHTRGRLAVAGVAASVRLTRALAIEGEVTSPGREIARSDEGTFIAYIPSPSPNPDRAEFERWAPIARRTLGYAPGLGVAGMVVGHAPVHARVTLAGRLGLSARRYAEQSRFVVLSIPDGVDPARVARDFAGETRHTIRGGLLVGAGADVALTRRITVAPHIRLVHSGPSRFGSQYREIGFGVSGRWHF